MAFQYANYTAIQNLIQTYVMSFPFFSFHSLLQLVVELTPKET